MIRIQDVWIKDFLCFSETHVKVDEVGLCCVLGDNRDSSASDSNGSGKSAFFDAVHYAFYGKALRKIPASDIIRRGAESAMVKVKFSSSNGEEYELRRERGNSSKDSLFSLRLIGGKEFSSEGKKDLKEKLENIVGMSSDLFKQVVVFGQSGAKRFSELGDVGKKKLVEEILGLSVYEKASKKARNRASKAKEEQEKGLVRMEGVELRVSQAKSHLQRAERIEMEWVSKKEIELLDLDRKELVIEGDISELEKKLGSMPAPTDVDSRLIEKKEELELQISKSRKIEDAYNQKRQPFLIDSSELKGKISFLEEEVHNKSKTTFEDICPTCGQAFHGDLKKVDNEIQSRVDELRECRELYEEKQQSLKNLEKAFSGIKEAAALKRKEIEKDIEFLSNEWEAYRKSKGERESVQKKYQKNVNALELLRERRDELRAQTNPHVEGTTQAKEDYEKVVEEREKIEKSLDELNKEVLKCGVLLDVFGPKGIRSYLFENVLPEINQRLKRYARLVSDGQISAQLSAFTEQGKGGLKEGVTVNVHNPTGGASYESLSSGEKRRLDLPIAFALQGVAAQRNKGLNIVLLDEVFENVDESGTRGIMRLLESVMVDDRGIPLDSMFVITHDESFSDMFSNVLRVKKERGSSVIHS